MSAVTCINDRLCKYDTRTHCTYTTHDKRSRDKLAKRARISVLGRRHGWSRATGSARPRTHAATAQARSTHDPALLAHRLPAQSSRVPKLAVGLAPRRPIGAAAEDVPSARSNTRHESTAVTLSTHAAHMRPARAARRAREPRMRRDSGAVKRDFSQVALDAGQQKCLDRVSPSINQVLPHRI